MGKGNDMNYKETITYLFNAAPLFQNVGAGAYKEGLSNTHLLDAHFDHPHTQYKTIHVAGTNGKGSCAHTIAAMLQHKGLKVGLYTSPHLVDFRERIRVNGEMISEEYVVDFIGKERAFFEPLHPSFFELTTAMVLKYFADERVDVAVIEVGLGGRLDCTNIIAPCLSVITNISFDHTQFLGNTLAQIASEKAGIIKKQTPIVIGEANAETRPVFVAKAKLEDAPITFAEDEKEVFTSELGEDGLRHYHTKSYGEVIGELKGMCQEKNTNTLLCVAKKLSRMFNLSIEDIQYGFRNVCKLTGLQGRWQVLGEQPMIVCDTGHNVGGWQYIGEQLQQCAKKYAHIHIVFGMANDKDVAHVLALLPKQAKCYWTQASVHRAMKAPLVAERAKEQSLVGTVYDDVPTAYRAALSCAEKDDFVYVGGSSFVVADLLDYLRKAK